MKLKKRNAESIFVVPQGDGDQLLVFHNAQLLFTVQGGISLYELMKQATTNPQGDTP
jgi:hypothetical protein